MFDLDSLISDCRSAAGDSDPRAAIRDVLRRTVERPQPVADALGRDEGGIEVLYCSDDVTVLNVIWAPHMTIFPHEHRMWAAIGIYAGAEVNQLYKRGSERIQRAGDRMLDTGDVFGLGADAIHAVHNPRGIFTGAVHVYGGDFVNVDRSQWDPDTLLEEPCDIEQVRRAFAEANAEWRAQVGQDLDESVV